MFSDKRFLNHWSAGANRGD